VNLEDLYRLLRTSHTQAQGIVDTVREPLLVLDRDLCIVAASRSFFQAFQVGRDETVGRPLYELGNGQWNIPDLRHLLEAVIPKSLAVEGYEVEHEFPHLGRRIMLLNARKLFHPDNNSLTLLLAIEDITEQRRAEGERELHFRELDHRMKGITVPATMNQRPSTCPAHAVGFALTSVGLSRTGQDWSAEPRPACGGAGQYRAQAGRLSRP
jgi:hypothetical protein